MDTAYIPRALFYAGNGKLVCGIALQNVAEHLNEYRCMDFIRKSFVEILEGLAMSDEDRAYYQWVAGYEPSDVVPQAGALIETTTGSRV